MSFPKHGFDGAKGRGPGEGRMKDSKPTNGLLLEVEELERGRKPGGCSGSSSTSPLCTCPVVAAQPRGNED